MSIGKCATPYMRKNNPFDRKNQGEYIRCDKK